MIQKLLRVRALVQTTSNRLKIMAAMGIFMLSAPIAQSQTLFGVSGTNLVSFSATTPGTVSTIAPITGITAGQAIEGLDFRPLNGQLYLLGYNSTTGAARLYTVNLTTAVATPIGGADITLATGITELGMDFNPTVDRIRVIGNTGQNYRLNPISGGIAATDLNIAYAGADVNSGITMPNVLACAYTNSYIAATSTQLFDVEVVANVLALQNPPNNGILNTIGSLGIAPNVAAHATDMDIYYNTMSATNTGYLGAVVAGTSNFYTINTTTGATTLVGAFGMQVEDFSAQIIVTTPGTVSGQLVYGLTSNSYLISFDSGMPSTIRSHMSISGITTGQVIVGMDSRPATGQVYVMGYNSTTGDAQLYTLNTSTGVATSVAVPAVLATGMTNVSFDFNPTVDRIRVTSAQDNNYRLHPNTGALLFTDGTLAYAGADVNTGMNPNIGGGAYTNSYIGGTATTLFNYDVTLNVLTSQNPPNAGTLNTVGSSGITVNVGDPSVDFDFFYNTATGLNENYMVANTTNNFDNLYTVNTTTGAVTSVGQVGFGTAVIDMAVQIVPNIPGTVSGQLVYGLTSNGYLISFDSGNPSVVRTHASLSGVTAGQTLVGLDSRPATGQLYAMGYNATTGDAQLYTINATTNVAASVAAPVVLATAMTNVSFDFNPSVDRIRVTSAQDNNYRLHPNTGAIVATDLTLAYAGADVNSAANPNIAAGAYTNSFIASSTTQLIGYDATLNVVTLQNPPNNGTLNTTGSSGITVNVADPSVDFDFFYNTATLTNENYMVANTTNNFDNLYTVNTTTGAVTSVGVVGNGIAVFDIAVQIVPNAPVLVAGQLIYGVTTGNYLVSFDSQAPSVVRTHVAVSGITAGQTLVGIDVRPATGQLYGLGYNSTTGDAQLYTIDPATAAATSVAAAVVLAPALGNIGMDFNPTVDRIRVITSSDANYRLHPTTGAIAATDLALNYATGDVNNGQNPSVGTGAYTNSYGGSNNTALFNYDDVLNVLVRQNPPNNGTLTTVGTSGITQNGTDVTSDLDIFYNHNLHTNTAFLVSNATTNDVLYTVNTTTGAATSVGTIGYGVAIRDIAVRNDSITTVSSTASTIAPVACGTYTAPNSTVYTASGTYTAIIPNAIGYDSLITINLTVNALTSSMVDTTVCGTSYTAPDGAVYTSSGTYIAMLTNVAGCDSTITINLVVNTLVTPNFSPVGPYCVGDTPVALENPSNNGIAGTWSPSTISTTAAGSTTYTFTPSAGLCASTATIAVIVSAPVIASFNAVGPYCIGETPDILTTTSNNGIAGTWSPATINTSATGTSTYTFTETAGQCADGTTLNVVIDSCLSINEVEQNAFTVYPNPSTGIFTVEMDNVDAVSSLTIVDAFGRIVKTIAITNTSTNVDLSNVLTGIYFIKVGTSVQQIVKK